MSFTNDAVVGKIELSEINEKFKLQTLLPDFAYLGFPPSSHAPRPFPHSGGYVLKAFVSVDPPFVVVSFTPL